MARDQDFSYTAIAPSGERRKGRMEGESIQAVVSMLQADGMVPLSVTPAVNTALNMNIKLHRGSMRMGIGDLASFARQLNLLVAAGLSMPRSLAVMGEDTGGGEYEEICLALSERTTAGVPLSKALEEFPETFPEVFRSYISAGEATGDMEKSTRRLAHTLEKQNQLRLKLKAVTAYPKLVAYAVAGLVVAILMFLVPRYAAIYQTLGQKLPGPTLMLIGISNSFVPVHFSMKGHNLLTAPINWLSPLIWIAGIVFGWRYFRRRTRDNIAIGTKVEKITWRIPVFGKLTKAQVMYRWSSTMAGSLSSGLQTFVALDLAGRTTGSAWMRGVSEDLKEAVRAGRPLSGELALHRDLFNAQLRAMAATGEEAGEPAAMFENIATTLEDELDTMVATLGAKIEVALLVTMGVVVGALLVVLYLPILNLSNAVGKGLGG